MKKILVTGISGFVGSHLAEYLLSQGSYDIFGTYLSENSLRNLELVKKNLHLTQVDLQKKEKVEKLVKQIVPDMIVHLAALPGVGSSYERPLETIINNVAAELNILEAVRGTKLSHCRLLIVTSADVYGKVSAKDIPIDEDTPFNPTNSYAVSKIAQDFLALQYVNAYSLAIIRARPFNHIGPRQAPGFVVADFAKNIAEIEKGKSKPTIHVGNLSSKRDFTDVRDIVRAYTLLIEKGEEGEVYNIGSGVSYQISWILNTLLSFTKVKIQVEVDKELFRGEDAPDRVCDSSKFTKLTGWKPTVPIEKTLQDTLEYFRNIV